LTLVRLSLAGYSDTTLGWRAQKGIELSHWCRSQGLDLGSDYEWSFQRSMDELHFWFRDPVMATFFNLKWGQ
jgi:hypothetical protein